MNPAFAKHVVSLTVSLLLILALFITARLYPTIGIILGLIVLLFGLAASGYTIVKKNRDACRKGVISRAVLARNVSVEMSGILLAMFLAAKAGRYLALIGTRQIEHEMTRLLMGLVIGLLAGAVTGALIKGVSNWMVRN